MRPRSTIEDAVGFAIVDGHPVREQLGGGVRTAGIERRGLLLRDFLHLAVEFAGAGLVEPGVNAGLAHRLEQAERTDAGNFDGVLGNIEAGADVALGAEVVDLTGRMVRKSLFTELASLRSP